MQIAFVQCQARLRTLIELHKVIRVWLDSAQAKCISRVVQPLATLELYLAYTIPAVRLAPDMQLIKCYGVFYDVYERTRRPSEALKTLRRSSMEVNIEELAAAKLREPPVEQATMRAKAESDDEDDDDDDYEGKTPQSKRKKSQSKKARDLPPLSNRIDMSADATTHAAVLCAEGLKLYFYAMPKAILSDAKLVRECVQEVRMVREHWSSSWAGPSPSGRTSGIGKDFGDALEALHIILRCGLEDERDKPPSTAARAARKTLFASSRDATAIGELSRAASAFASLKSFMEASRLHAAQGLEDQSACNLFEEATARFEGAFEGAFADLAGWATPMAASTSNDFSLRQRLSELGQLKSTLVTLQGVLNRWSSAALQEQLEVFCDGLCNMLGVLSTSSWTWCASLVRGLQAPLEALQLEPQAFCRAAMGPDRCGGRAINFR